MNRRTFTATRVGMLLLIIGLVLGRGLTLAQTQGVAQPPNGTPAGVTQTPADTPDKPAQFSAEEAKAEPAEEAEATSEEPEAAATTTSAEAAAAESVQGRTVSRMRSTTQAQRQAAARNLAERIAKRGPAPRAPIGCTAPLGTPCVQVNYFGTVPNFAFSKLPTITPSSVTGVLPVTYTVTAGTGIRKFVDTLPGLGPANKNNLGNYIPVATPIANSAFPNDDYYQIGLIDYTQRFHTDLPATTQVRGYVDLNPTPLAAFRTSGDIGGHYLGPVIIAQRNRPVRAKFTNNLAANSFFFLPADVSYMGMMHDENGVITPYSLNRATLHLHGGATPWISDGTPHQWTVPVGEYAASNFKRGVSVQFVPDMYFSPTAPYGPVLATAAGATNDPGPGSLSFFYTNAQSGRFMFYHDHSYGTTRLNVYAGEAAGYLLHDSVEDGLIGTAIPTNAGVDLTSTANLGLAGLNVPGGIYHFGIPLIIQDKTFVPPQAQLGLEDPSWNWGNEGNFWFPHVYMPNQNPNDNSGASPAGRWDYGPWFWPPMTSADLAHGAITCLGTGDKALFGPAAQCPGTLNPSGVPEAFMDTPLVNGQAYPTVTVPRGAYRFQILNAANDRMFNLSLFYAADANGNVCNPSYTRLNNLGTANVLPATSACTEVKVVAATPHPQVIVTPPAGLPAPEAPADKDDTVPACASSPTNPDVIRGSGFLVTANPLAADYNPLTGLPGLVTPCWPSSWPTDGRDGGVPDPSTAGPAWVQIGTEGGVLPAPVVIPPTPVGYNYNRRDIVVTNVQEHALFLGPAERADVIVDLTNVPDGATLMLYNDAPAPVPGFDSRLDYYTGDVDQSLTGGAPTTQPGFGPNIRTIMQIHVTGSPTSTFSLATLKTALPAVFQQSQPAVIIPQTTYPAAALSPGGALGLPAKDTYARIQNTSGLTYTPMGGVAVTTPLAPKAIHELFEVDYGKMNSILAAEIPITNFNNQTTLPLAYVDPPTEIVADNQTQLWKVTHNGVDTHAMHFHLFDVQLINRVGWDGAIRPPDPNELGWKETVRMNPLEDAIVALRPQKPPIPFFIPGSSRLLDPTRALNATNTASQPGFSNNVSNAGVADGNTYTTQNLVQDFGWEYVWHCHLLGHEESDMMRPVVFQIATPAAPFNLAGSLTGTTSVTLTWSYTQGTTAATGFLIQRAPAGGAFVTLAAAANLPLSPLTFIDTTAAVGNTYSYRVFAISSVTSSLSAPSNTVTVSYLAAPTNLRQTSIGTGFVIVAWTAPTSTAGETGYALSRCTGTNAFCAAAPASAWTTVANTAITTTTYRNIGLQRGTLYTYRVQATGPGGTASGFSNLLTVTAQ